jgi:hypothetical protein
VDINPPATVRARFASAASVARGAPNGRGFLARRIAGRAKLLLSRIPAASVSSIPAAPQKRWQAIIARTSVQRLDRSLAVPGLQPSFHRISENPKAIGGAPPGLNRPIDIDRMP